MNLKFPSCSQDLLNSAKKINSEYHKQSRKCAFLAKSFAWSGGTACPIKDGFLEAYSCKMQENANCYTWDFPRTYSHTNALIRLSYTWAFFNQGLPLLRKVTSDARSS